MCQMSYVTDVTDSSRSKMMNVLCCAIYRMALYNYFISYSTMYGISEQL
jgi:hypothetical protein